MLPDQTVVDAGKTFLDAGVIGASAVFLMVALIWTMRRWLKTLDDLDAEKDARLADAKLYAALGEESRKSMNANTEAVRAMLEVVKDRGRG